MTIFLFTIMDNELKNFRLNITLLAAITDLHRQTVTSKLANVQPAQDLAIQNLSFMPSPISSGSC